MGRSQQGVGNLLIFLAMIVVAVLASTVFITTASNLQQKAFAVASDAKERVSASVDIDSISGIKDPYPARTVHNITMTIRLAPGADPIKLDDNGTTIQILTDRWQLLSVKYGGIAYNGAIWPNNFTNFTYNKFYIWVNQSTDKDGYLTILSPGELYTIVIPLNPNNTIYEETPVTIKFVSRTGMSSIIKFRAPTVIKDEIVPLYPT